MRWRRHPMFLQLRKLPLAMGDGPLPFGAR